LIYEAYEKQEKKFDVFYFSGFFFIFFSVMFAKQKITTLHLPLLVGHAGRTCT